jgi:hypothetical protein
LRRAGGSLSRPSRTQRMPSSATRRGSSCDPIAQPLRTD